MKIKDDFFNWSQILNRGEGGFVILSSIMAISIVFMYAFSVTSIIVEQQKESRKAQDSLTKLNLKPLFLNIFDSEICKCHLDASQNTSIPTGSSLMIDTTGSLIDDIDLGSLRSGCDFTSSDNIIIESGKPLLVTPGLLVDSVSLTQIAPIEGAQDEYLANLTIQYEREGSFSYKPIIIPLAFFVNSNSGTPSGRPIESCQIGSLGDGNDLEQCYYVQGANTHIGCGRSSDIFPEGTASFGFQTGPNNLGIENTFMGSYAGSNNFLGMQNSFLGYESGYSNANGNFNINIGFKSGYSNLDGDKNVSVGYQSGRDYQSSKLINVGYQAGLSNLKSGNIFIGSQSGKNSVNGPKNTFIGAFSGLNNTGGQNTLVGSRAGEMLEGGNGNTFMGYMAGAGSSTFSSSSNLFIGYQSGSLGGLGGDGNIFIGSFSGRKNGSGINNVGIGYSAGSSNETGSGNIFIGKMAGVDLVSHDDNVLVGYQSGLKVKGNKNVFIGYNSGKSIESGSGSIFIGNLAGENTKEGVRSIYIGYKAGSNAAVGAVDVPDGQQDQGHSLVGRGNDVVAIGVGALANAKSQRNCFLGGRGAQL